MHNTVVQEYTIHFVNYFPWQRTDLDAPRKSNRNSGGV